MKKFFSNTKDKINAFLKEFLAQKSQTLVTINRWGPDVPVRLSDFATNGKAVRGGLVCLAYNMMNKKINQEVIKAASAVELYHSSLLIHDDIIDKDELRRGKRSIYAQYGDLAKGESLKEPNHFGISQAICAGDIGFFFAYELLANLKTDAETKIKLIDLCAREITIVGLAEMHDVYLGFSPKMPTTDEVTGVYRYKTARYTFSLPLTIGAMLAKAPDKTIKQLDTLGEHLGIIFQIKDDELGLFGDEVEIGKPIGSDVKEEKKTLYYLYLFEKASRQQKEKLKEIFGKPKITPEMLDYVRKTIIELGIKEKVDKDIERLEIETRKMITKLDVPRQYKKILFELLDYNLARKK